MCAQDIPTPSVTPRIASTTQAIAPWFLGSSHPRLTTHQTIAAKRASNSRTPSAPIDMTVERMKKMEAGKIAPMAVFLASDAAAEVTAQIFAVRANEIMLMGQSRPLRSVHMAEGWTPETIASTAIPAMRGHFYALERSPDVINWDPI